MNLEHLKELRTKLDNETDLNILRNDIKKEIDRIIRFLETNLEEDFRHLEADIHELENVSIDDREDKDDLNEIIGNIKTDFSEFQKDFDVEL